MALELSYERFYEEIVEELSSRSQRGAKSFLVNVEAMDERLAKKLVRNKPRVLAERLVTLYIWLNLRFLWLNWEESTAAMSDEVAERLWNSYYDSFAREFQVPKASSETEVLRAEVRRQCYDYRRELCTARRTSDCQRRLAPAVIRNIVGSRSTQIATSTSALSIIGDALGDGIEKILRWNIEQELITTFEWDRVLRASFESRENSDTHLAI